jgi:hypothetical protein
MSVLLNRAYLGYPIGTVVELPLSTEQSLIAQNLAQTALTSATTPGAITANVAQGTAAVAAGASSVVVTNSLVTASSIIYAVVGQAAADTTFTNVQRVVAAAGSFTVFGPANATAATIIDWAIVQSPNTSGN